MTRQNYSASSAISGGSVREVFIAFLGLGLLSFGGPAAHLGYFRETFVNRKKWLTDAEFAQLVALSQFLPGPGSSQVGLSIGLLRAGWIGALAAFVAFTLPSVGLLLLFALLLPELASPAAGAAVHGLGLVAVVVVAHSVLGMLRDLCPDLARKIMACAAALLVWYVSEAWSQVLVVLLGAAAGVVFIRETTPAYTQHLRLRYGKKLGCTLIVLFSSLLLGLPFLAKEFGGVMAISNAFYHSGALVFGGGHVVLPLLEEAVVSPGWVSADDFMAGYGAAQAIPGPLFSFAAYLGALITTESPAWVVVFTAVIAVFLPGFLLMLGVLPLWASVGAKPRIIKAIAGVNAAVVGLLAAAFYDPIWSTAVKDSSDIAIVVVGFFVLRFWRVSPLMLVLWCLSASMLSLWI